MNKSGSEIMGIINPQGEIVFRNVKFLEFFRDILKYNNPKSIQSTADLPEEANSEFIMDLRIKIDISLKEGIVTEFRYISANSKDNWINFLCTPVMNEDKIVECVILIGQTINTAMELSADNLDLFNASFFHYFNCNKNLEIDSLVTNSGIEAETITGNPISELFPKSLLKRIDEQISELSESRKFIHFTHDFSLEERTVHADIKILLNKSGFIIILEDLTDQSHKDSELRKYVEELHYNKIISEQYAKELSLVNRKLNESEEELKKLNADKDKFFSIVAHDLRGPFSSLLGFSDYLAKEAHNLEFDEIKTYAKSIFTTGRHLLALLENLLQWSRVQLGRIEFSPEAYDLTEQLKSLSEYFAHMATQKSITVALKAPAHLTVTADRNMIETVVRNLMSNALKFTPDKGQINLVGTKKKNMIEIRVEDNGVGMSKTDKDKLFRIDSQHTTLGTRNEKGSGLGLLICKEFVEKNNGEIVVESKLGKGTKFILRIPLTNSAETASQKPKKTRAQKTSGYQFSK